VEIVNFKGKTGQIKFEVVLVEEGQNTSFIRYEVLDKNDLILIINKDSFFTWPRRYFFSKRCFISYISLNRQLSNTV
jgi:hypothetical protein